MTNVTSLFTRSVFYGLVGAFSCFGLQATAQVSPLPASQTATDVSPQAVSDFQDRVQQVYLNGKALILDKSTSTYYFPLPESLRGGADFTAVLSADLAPGYEDYTLRLNEQEPAADGSVTIPAVDCNRYYQLALYPAGSSERAGVARVAFTFLPVVEVNVATCNSETYTRGSLRVTDPDTEGQDQTWAADFRYRGASSLNYDKKSYAIKLRDADGESADGSFFGLREDNNWILDAMAVDQACMRNRVSTDLWNAFATQPYFQRDGREDETLTGTRGRFVEVFLNGSYHGLYCMTEKLDRKQLKLKKYKEAEDGKPDQVRGTLFKSNQWCYEVLMGHEPDVKSYPRRAPRAYDNNSGLETWADFEVDYPDYEDERVDWGPLWRAINLVAAGSDAAFSDSVATYFDLPVLRDYYLFIELMLASDNHGKNMFFFNYNQQEEPDAKKIGIAPWDLDGTWGRRWDGSSNLTGAAQDFETFLWNYEHGTLTLFDRLADTDATWRPSLATRYAELRETYFSEASLTGRFRTYADLFEESGAASREGRQWRSYHPDIEADVDYICDWIGERLQWLDRQYGYTPDAIASAPQAAQQVQAEGGKGFLLLHGTSAEPVRIYTADGRLVRTLALSQQHTQVDGLAPGLYLVGTQKVLVR